MKIKIVWLSAAFMLLGAGVMAYIANVTNYSTQRITNYSKQVLVDGDMYSIGQLQQWIIAGGVAASKVPRIHGLAQHKSHVPIMYAAYSGMGRGAFKGMESVSDKTLIPPAVTRALAAQYATLHDFLCKTPTDQANVVVTVHRKNTHHLPNRCATVMSAGLPVQFCFEYEGYICFFGDPST